MKPVLTTTFLLLAGICFAQTPSQEEKELNMDSAVAPKAYAAIGQPFPWFEAKNGAEKVNNTSLKGKVVLINFWFEGCHPCMAEMKALNELHQKLKGNKDFLFISFTWDDQQTIQRVKTKYGITFKVLSTSAQECKRLLIDRGYPTNMILDKTGKLRYLHGGAGINEAASKEFVMTTLLSEIQSLL